MVDIPENEISGKGQKWVALLSGIVGFVAGNFYYDTLTTAEFLFNPLWFLHNENKLIFSMPGLIHGIIAMALLAPLYIRRILRYRNISIISLLLFVSNVYLFSTWIQLAMGFKVSFTNTFVSMGLVAAIALSWLGMRSISGFCWMIVVFLCMYNMLSGSEMLASWGVFFLVCSVVSIWFQTKLPLDEYFSVLKGEFLAASNSQLSQSVRENSLSAFSSCKGFFKGG